MTGKKEKKSIFWLLVGLPFSMVATLFIVYVTIYGLQLPFELKMKVQNADGKFVSASTMAAQNGNPRLWPDSLQALYSQIEGAKDTVTKLRQEMDRCRDTLIILQQFKDSTNSEFVQLQSQLKMLNQQKDGITQEKMVRMNKIFKSMSPDQLDSLYVASLDDNTLMTILTMAKEQQAAAILQRMEPKRAARLTSQYLNQEMQ